ncbi:hypothetical protein [Bradyrhizobium sp. CCBAU 051011]|uniref:hypothetical protein n=1 Tax=Bradyrhizobium sp. CCBAU 051011 TaxID=858422 RepID=UPI00137B32DD|nr:hypothetical protein [Bradyrhizobium sp. CCBAU 051011]
MSVMHNNHHRPESVPLGRIGQARRIEHLAEVGGSFILPYATHDVIAYLTLRKHSSLFAQVLGICKQAFSQCRCLFESATLLHPLILS